MNTGDLVLVHASSIGTNADVWARVAPIVHRACVVVDLDDTKATIAPFPDSGGLQTDVPVELLMPVHRDVVPPKLGRKRAVLYLDQCVLSELVKFQTHRLKGANAAAAKALLSALDEAVLHKQTAICVESFFHQQESSGLASPSRGGRDMLRAAFEFLCLRSRHLRLEGHSHILLWQTRQRIAFNSGATLLPAKYLWQTGLSRDPDECNGTTGVLGGQFVAGIPWTPVESSPNIAAQLEQERSSGDFGSFAVELDKCNGSWRAETGGLRRTLLAQNFATGEGGGLAPSATDDFLRSGDFLDLPYVHCATHLSASLLSEKSRRFKDSDFNDVRFAARAMPYCDLMIVDADLANRIHSLKLDRHYSTKVVPAKLKGYHEAADWLRNDSRTRCSA